ncbi:hypothetical protein EMCRGX_G013177 [Ephydatia muelleri]
MADDEDEEIEDEVEEDEMGEIENEDIVYGEEILSVVMHEHKAVFISISSLNDLSTEHVVTGHIVRGDRCLKDYGFRLSQARVDSAEDPELRRLAKLHALSWLHGLAGLQQLGGLPLVKPTTEGLKRMLAKPTVRKEPVTADMLKDMVEATGTELPLSEVRLLAVCLVAFDGFLHCNELIKLTFNAEGTVINVQSSKMDQYWECASLVIAHTGSVTCPVSMMERYFHMGMLDRTSHGTLFRAIVLTKEGESLHNAGGLSYSRLRELLLDKIAKLAWV